MSNIRTTVTEALHANGLGHYAVHAGPVIAALSERENRLANALVDIAEAQGLSNSQAWDLLADAGFDAPEPEVQVAAAPEPSDTNAVLARIESTLNGLVSFARRNGYSG